MSPVESAAAIGNLQLVIYTLLALSGGLAGVIWMLAGQVHRGCVNCDHCLLREHKERLAADEEHYATLRSLRISEDKIAAKKAERDAAEMARYEGARRNKDRDA